MDVRFNKTFYIRCRNIIFSLFFCVLIIFLQGQIVTASASNGVIEKSMFDTDNKKVGFVFLAQWTKTYNDFYDDSFVLGPAQWSIDEGKCALLYTSVSGNTVLGALPVNNNFSDFNIKILKETVEQIGSSVTSDRDVYLKFFDDCFDNHFRDFDFDQLFGSLPPFGSGINPSYITVYANQYTTFMNNLNALIKTKYNLNLGLASCFGDLSNSITFNHTLAVIVGTNSNHALNYGYYAFNGSWLDSSGHSIAITSTDTVPSGCAGLETTISVDNVKLTNGFGLVLNYCNDLPYANLSLAYLITVVPNPASSSVPVLNTSKPYVDVNPQTIVKVVNNIIVPDNSPINSFTFYDTQPSPLPTPTVVPTSTPGTSVATPTPTPSTGISNSEEYDELGFLDKILYWIKLPFVAVTSAFNAVNSMASTLLDSTSSLNKLFTSVFFFLPPDLQFLAYAPFIAMFLMLVIREIRR